MDESLKIPVAAEPTEITPNGSRPVCVSFSSNISAQTAPVLMGSLADLANKNHDEIHLLLSTPGGTVQDGIAIYNFIRALPVSVIVYNVGSVNSIGNVVYQAAARRVASTVSSFMFHGVGFDIQNARLERKQLQERMQGIENDQSRIADIMVRHTQLGRDQLDKLFLDMGYLSSNEALQCGVTDEVTDFCLPQGMPILQLIFK